MSHCYVINCEEIGERVWNIAAGSVALCAEPCTPSPALPRGEWAWRCIPVVSGPERVEARDSEVLGHPHSQLYGELEALSHKKLMDNPLIIVYPETGSSLLKFG